MTKLSNRDCSGPLAFGTSLCLPGDYALPHQDLYGARSVTLNWYLTRDWSPLWGGELHWCRSWERVAPGFNVVALFNVSAEARHYVSHVLPTARGRRFTVNNWWQSPTPETATRPLRAQSGDAFVPSLIPGLRVLA